MRIINAKMQFTTDCNTALSIMNQQPNTKCIFVGDSMGRYDVLFNNYGVIPASVLMPDYMCMEADINGTIQEFQSKYYAYLNTEEPRAMMITLIAALYHGINIVLFVPKEASGLRYPKMLLSYIQNIHGIIVESPQMNIIFNYNPAYDLFNADCLYGYSLISPAEYLMLAGPKFDMLNKLCIDTGMIFASNTPPEEVWKYFNEWRENMLATNKPTKKIIGYLHNQ